MAPRSCSCRGRDDRRRSRGNPAQDVLCVNPEAYDAYLRDRFYGQHQNRDAKNYAVGNLERASALYPNFAAAHGELAQAYVRKLFLEPNQKRPTQP